MAANILTQNKTLSNLIYDEQKLDIDYISVARVEI